MAPPETPAGHALASWLDAFNSADETRTKAYTEKYQPMVPVDLQVPFRQQTGGLDLTGIRISEPLHIEFSTKERARDTRAIGELILSGSDPPRITGFALLAIPPGNPPVLGFSITAQTRRSTEFPVKLRQLRPLPCCSARRFSACRRWATRLLSDPRPDQPGRIAQ